jgi:uncharacterized membrane protein
METVFLEWLNVGLRWLHILTAIMWIGNSFYFMWLDRHLAPAFPADEKVEGVLWMVHSGGFYQVERRKIFPGEIPKVLHWFKWEATFTWISGFCLLVLIYYTTAGLYLLDPRYSTLTSGAAILVSLSLLMGSWFVYDFFMQTQWGNVTWFSNAFLFILVTGLTYGLTHHFSGRASFIQLGAIFGTIMVLNVWVRILPAQSIMIAAAERGVTPDYSLSKSAKERSTHNSYMTLPVLFMMICNHYAFLYGHQYNWILILLFCVLGVSIRDLMIHNRPAYLVAIPAALSLLLLIYLTSPNLTLAFKSGMPVIEDRIEFKSLETVAVQENSQGIRSKFDEVKAIVVVRCLPCHSSNPTDSTFGPTPGGVNFDFAENIKAYSQRIGVRAVETKTMPWGNRTNMTEEERKTIAEWISQSIRN